MCNRVGIPGFGPVCPYLLLRNGKGVGGGFVSPMLAVAVDLTGLDRSVNLRVLNVRLFGTLDIKLTMETACVNIHYTPTVSYTT